LTIANVPRWRKMFTRNVPRRKAHRKIGGPILFEFPDGMLVLAHDVVGDENGYRPGSATPTFNSFHEFPLTSTLRGAAGRKKSDAHVAVGLEHRRNQLIGVKVRWAGALADVPIGMRSPFSSNRISGRLKKGRFVCPSDENQCKDGADAVREECVKVDARRLPLPLRRHRQAMPTHTGMDRRRSGL